MESQETSFRSLDGLTLRGVVVHPAQPLRGTAILVHGGGVTRDEGGFFVRLADGLAGLGIASLRFDFRGHGQSDGRQEDLTLAGVVNDIRAAAAHLEDVIEPGPIGLIGTSFGGGISAFFAAHYPERVRRLVLLNPLLNYKKRFVDDKPYWQGDRIDKLTGRTLSENGFVEHSPTFKLGRGLLNEVFYLRPELALKDITAPTLIVHGTGDTFIPVESSRTHIRQIPAETVLLEIDGAQHGFAVHDDPGYRDPQSQKWQAEVIDAVTAWLARD